MWRLMVLTMLFFTLSSELNYAAVLAQDEMTSISDDSRITDSRLFLLSEGDVETATISWLGHRPITLTQNEINSLIRLLKDVQKNDVTPYNGPAPKGGTVQLSILLKSNEKFTLILNGKHFLFGGSQVYQPAFREFTKQVMLKHFN